MPTISYADKLKKPKWQKKRVLILQRDDFKCTMCGDTETELHVHHEKYIGENPWDTPDEFLRTLCKNCHSVVEQISSEGFCVVSVSIKKSKSGSTTLFTLFLKDKKDGKLLFSFFEKITPTSELDFKFAIPPNIVETMSVELQKYRNA